jgi:membrane associated rhomboid family serine protease
MLEESILNYAARNTKGLRTTIVAEFVFVILAIWQFYQFVTFKDSTGIFDLHGGYRHLWIAICIALLACVTGFFIFSIFLRRDREDELHITSRG